MKRLMCFILFALCLCCASCEGSSENTASDPKKENSDSSRITSEVLAEDDEGQNGISAADEITQNNVTVYPIKLIRTDGKLYYDTGENSRMTPRCGTLDGNIRNVCDEYKVPQKDNEANFGGDGSDYYGSGWQNMTDNTKEVPTQDGWRIFKRVDMDSIFVYELKSCMRVVGDDFEEIILSSSEITFDDNGNAIYAEKKSGEKRITLPVKYGQVYDWGITMSAKDVTTTGMTLVIKQSAGNLVGELETGSAYALQKWNGKFWEHVSYASEGAVAWDDVAYIIPKDGEREFPIKWKWLYGELPSGRYMISKSFMDFKGAAGHDDHTFYLEFEIPEESVKAEKSEDADVFSDNAEALCGYPLYEG